MDKIKERIIFKPREEDQILLKDGKKYRFLKETMKENGHVNEVIFEEINEVEYEDQLDRMASYLIEKSGLDAKTIIKDVLRQSSTNELNKIENEMKKESPVEIVPGCLALKIGKRRIEIVE